MMYRNTPLNQALFHSASYSNQIHNRIFVVLTWASAARTEVIEVNTEINQSINWAIDQQPAAPPHTHTQSNIVLSLSWCYTGEIPK